MSCAGTKAALWSGMNRRALALVVVVNALVAAPALAGPSQEVGGHWLSDSFTLEVVPNEDVIATDDLMKATEAAAETWNKTGLGPQIVVVPAAAGVTGGFALDGHNTLTIVKGDWHGNHQFSGLTQRALQGGVIIETDSMINASDWKFCDGAEHGKVDLQSVLTHELGHTLGLLDDIEHGDATMYYASHEDDVSKRDLHAEDVSALDAAYANVKLDADNAAAAGCSSAGMSGAPAFLVLGALVARRRFSRGRRLGVSGGVSRARVAG
jgi:hypothetical protein